MVFGNATGCQAELSFFFKSGRKQFSCLESGMENISHALMFIVSKVIDLSLVFSSAAASHCYAIKLIGMSQNIFISLVMNPPFPAVVNSSNM